MLSTGTPFVVTPAIQIISHRSSGPRTNHGKLNFVYRSSSLILAYEYSQCPKIIYLKWKTDVQKEGERGKFG